MWVRRQFAPNTLQITLLLAGIVGLLGALATVAFREALSGLQFLLAGHHSGMVELAQDLNWWQRLLLPTAGGLVAGLILQYASLWVPKKGSDDYMEAIAIGTGVLSLRQTLVKSLSSLCSVASGASIGREGPMVQLAAMFASLVGRILAFPPERLRLLVACGATAGITSAYNAPIAGALFISEIVYGSISTATLGPLVVASVIANIVIRQFLGYDAVYQMPRFDFVSGWEVLFYMGLGVLAGVLAPLFLRLLDTAKARFGALPIPLFLRLALGGLIVGVLSLQVPQVWGNGYSVVNSILHTHWAWQALAMVLVFKVLATASSAGSGGVGGVFTPTLFVGAALGSLYGIAMNALAPATASVASSYAVVGMGAFLAATTYAPLMSILMIFEMTLSYQVVLPLMLACVTAYLTAHTLRADSVYAKSLRRNQVAGRWLSMTGEGSEMRLSSLAVDNDNNDAVVSAADSSDAIGERFVDTGYRNLVVRAQDGRLIGTLDAASWWRRQATGKPELWTEIVTPCKALDGDMALVSALRSVGKMHADWVPVTGADGEWLGVVSLPGLIEIVTEERGSE
ncbi:ClcB-like voltage-gated chloride channel protein [Pandoraea capi]|uniref:ClcB-like voltage-gated chloride channel protein n=1 Tax=Pandoraea TaxID=93217 RepID=UPI001F5D6502|nr:ClcB-like voltage-gated chloride channel protein [Pandoraea capi]MCI3207118.1 chloride channel protein [Pandoraea sp. LA3]MDN4585146.1 voltage-gated chloride channel ClcB [Pandoraea capi]